MNSELSTKAKNDFLTTGQVALYCGVNFRTVIRWIQRGYLSAHRLPGRGDRRVSKDEFLRFLKINNLKFPKNYQHQKQIQKVLIVDDNEFMAKSIARTLRQFGFEIQIALNGLRAGFIINQEKPNLVTLDLKMKGVDGFEVLNLIHTSEELKHTKVLLVSGDSPERLKLALDQGAHDILPKPFSNQDLESKIIALLNIKKPYESQ